MTKPFKATYEMKKTTKAKIMFGPRTKPGERVRYADFGNLYLSKALHRSMGEPFVLKLTVMPVMPGEEEEDE